MQRYRKYIGSPTRPAADIKQRLATWKTTWLSIADSTTRVLLGSPHSERAVDLQIERVDDIVDLGWVVVELRKKPNQSHDLTEKQTTRGKIEGFHSVSGDFGNTSMTPRAAHMLHMRGTYRWNAERRQKKDYHAFHTDELKVLHFAPWLQYRANALAVRAGLSKPYPQLPDLQDDTGERFGWDYFLQQIERQKQFRFLGTLDRCPCNVCDARRSTCLCHACKQFRGETISSTSVETRGNLAKSALRAAAGLQASSLRQQQLMTLGTLLSRGHASQAATFAQQIGVDLRVLLKEYTAVQAQHARAAQLAQLTSQPPSAVHVLKDLV